MDRPDIITLHFNLPDKYIHIHMIYNPVTVEEISTNISIREYRLAVYLNGEQIALSDINPHHEV